MDNKNIIFLLLTALQKDFSQPLAYYPPKDMFVFVGEKDADGQTPLYPITGNQADILWVSSTDELIFPPSRLLAMTQSAKTSFNQSSTNVRPEFDQATTREKSKPRPEQDQDLFNAKSDFDQATIKGQPRTKNQIIAYYRLVDFSQFLPKGYLRELSKQIFDLTVKTLHTKNQKVIDEVLNLYDKALHYSDNPNHKELNELRKIKSRLETIYNRQQSANHNREEYKRRKSVRRKVLFFSVLSLFLIVSLSFGVRKFWLKPQPKSQVEQILLTDSLINAAIDQYQAQTGVKVWQWRRNKIISELAGKTMSDAELSKTLDSLITKAWK